MTIRIARSEDLESVREIATAAYHRYIARIGKEPAPMVADFEASIQRGQLFVSVSGERVDGFVVFYEKGTRMHLENVAVAPVAQGRGIGKQLIEYVESTAAQAGFAEVELYTNALMTENLDIYPRLGYQQFDRRLEDGFDRVYFKKPV